MEKILHIETATDICSVALSEGEKVLSVREIAMGKSHAGVLTVYINEIFEETGISISTLGAVAVSMGPGSYTGLRIGTSVAKGLCYGLNIPLIAVPTLEAMYFGAKATLQCNNKENGFYIPMIDARRMEVYKTVFDNVGNQLEETCAYIVNSDSFDSYFNKGKVYLFGTGASKLKPIINNANAVFIDGLIHSSVNMVNLALEKYRNKMYEDVAYFEPFYLKEFIATTPKKNILGNFENRA